MRVCPKCGFTDNPLWKPLFWKIYWEYIPQEDYPDIPKSYAQYYCPDGGFHYNWEDKYFYYRFAGKTRKMIHRFPKGFESMGNKKLYEKTPSEYRLLEEPVK